MEEKLSGANETSVEAGSENQSSPSRLRRWMLRMVVLMVGCLLLFAVAEIGLRICGVSYPQTGVRDDYRGFAYRPGVSFWQNDEGFRDPDRAEEKPPDTVRIAVIGDSYVDALQVDVEKRLTEGASRK